MKHPSHVLLLCGRYNCINKNKVLENNVLIKRVELSFVMSNSISVMASENIIIFF